MRIAHIGLEKTATTNMQKQVLRRLARSQGLRYARPQDFDKFLAAPADAPVAGKYQPKGRFFASAEILVGSDPWDWAQNCARNLAYLGKDTTVILILRHPKDHMRAVFQHISHQQGLLIEPKDFFKSTDNYDRNSPHPLFNVDEFDYQRLVSLYSNAFDRVVVQHYETIDDLRFLKAVFDLTADEVAEAEQSLHKARPLRPFSQTAVDFSWKLRSVLTNETIGGTRQKVDTLRRYRLWRLFIQGVFDRVYPYKPYQIDWSSLPMIDLEKLDAAYKAIPDFQMLRNKQAADQVLANPSGPVQRNLS